MTAPSSRHGAASDVGIGLRTPSPEQLGTFVSRLQRLLTGGEFVSTYKLALLIALSRWAIEHPDHDERQPLDVCALAGHFVELYWPHVLPFHVDVARVAESRPDYGAIADGAWRDVLAQDRGQQDDRQVPRILKEIRRARAGGARSFAQLPDPERQALLRIARRSIADMPLWKLHSVRESDEPMRFLYRRGRNRSEIVFEPGIVACLAWLAPLVEDIVRGAWLRFVIRCNPRVLGRAAQVEEFLFPGSRAALASWRGPLQEVQGDRCFYCSRRIAGVAAVDHFLPWSLYRRDLGHNFVLAHAGCNEAKGDRLASCDHLERWCARNREHGRSLGDRFDARNLPHDLPALQRVAASLYSLAEGDACKVWRQGRSLIALTPEWRRLLGVA